MISNAHIHRLTQRCRAYHQHITFDAVLRTCVDIVYVIRSWLAVYQNKAETRSFISSKFLRVLPNNCENYYKSYLIKNPSQKINGDCVLLTHLLNLYESWSVFEFYIVDLIYIEAVLSVYITIILHIHSALMGNFKLAANCTILVLDIVATVNMAVSGRFVSRVSKTASIRS